MGRVTMLEHLLDAESVRVRIEARALLCLGRDVLAEAD
jgi:hypothetical protein